MRTPLLHHQIARRDLQKIHLVERVVRPQDLIVGLDFRLAAARRRELVVEQQAPELRRRFGGGGDGGDEVVGECGVVGAVVGELQELGGGVEGVGAGVAGGGAGAEVGAVAEVGAAAGGGDVARAAVDGGFVDCVGGAFDAEVYPVGSGEGVVLVWVCGLWCVRISPSWKRAYAL